MRSQETTFAHLIHYLVVRNCRRRGTRYRVWCEGRLVGELVRKEDADIKARTVNTFPSGRVTVEQIW